MEKELKTIYINHIDEILEIQFEENISDNESKLATIKSTIFDVTAKLIDDVEVMVDDLRIMLDKVEETIDLGFMGKIIFYRNYIKKIIELFNEYNDQNITIINDVIPEYNEEAKIDIEGSKIIFTHGYSAKNSGKESLIVLFNYIDNNFIREKSYLKVKK